MKKRVMLILSCLLLSIGFIVAQTSRISGTVVDGNGEPVISASVVVKGTTVGTVTDLDGNFSINVPEDKNTLVFTLVGMVPVEVKASNGMRVAMEYDDKTLDEVIVVAYGTAKKSSFTGAANTINSGVLKDAPVVSFEQALQGAAPGISISASSGQPGAKQNISIRGVGSINASTDPLYVVDGVPLMPENLSMTGVGGANQSLSITSAIRPSDIETITVLKDAAATSLYGSRAANGVILITTKTGKAGKTKVSLKAMVGFNDWAVDHRPTVSGPQLRELWYESRYNNYIDVGKTPEYAATNATEWIDYYAPEPVNGKYYDWEDALFRKHGSNQSYEVNLNGGSPNTKFFLSLGYNDQKGKAKNSWAKQYTGRLNLSHEVGKIKMGTNIAIAKIDQEQTAEGTAYANPFYAIKSYLLPTTPIYNEDGSYYTGYLLNGVGNLAQSGNVDRYPQDVFDARATLWAEYNIYDNLKIKETFSYGYNNNNATTAWPFSGSNGANMDGLTIKLHPTSSKIYSSTILTYDKTVGAHSFDALLGWDVEKKIEQTTQTSGSGFGTDRITDLSAAAIPLSASSYRYDDRMLSGLSRVNYNYDNRYYASTSFRRDGSSRFGSNHRWGSFWSLSGAWRITGESFMQKATWMNDLRIKTSYGETGTLPSSWYASQDTYTAGGSYMKQPVFYPSRIPNPDLSWEKSQTLNVGFDARFFHRLSVEFDYYNKITKDLIAPIPVSQTTGFSTYLSNEGEMSNEGIELNIGVDVINTKDLYWNTRVNLAHNVNKVTKIYGGKDNTSRSYMITREGEAYYSFYMREYAGVNPETGAEQWYTNKEVEDENGNVTIQREITEDGSKAFRTVVGKADPKLTGGWLNNFRYKGFELSALVSFSIGGKFIDGGWSAVSNGLYDFDQLPSISQMDRWQNPGDKTDVGRRTYGYLYGNYTSSKWLHSSTHARLKTLSLSYSLPENLVQKINMNSVRFIISGSNLLTIKKTPGFDPEAAYNGIVGYSFPPLKDLTFGVEVAF